MHALLLGLLGLSCELAGGQDARQPEAAGDPTALSRRRFDLQGLVASLADSPHVLPLPSHTPYWRLAERAADSELRGLLQHSAPAVRVYAFHALSERHPQSSLFTELSGLLGDVAVVQVQGDRQKLVESTVADYALERVEGRLSEIERKAVAARVLESGIPAQFAARIKRKWTLGPELHEPLRALARAGDGDALLALGRYRDLADIPLIVAGLEGSAAIEALQAVGEFPDPSFVAPLRALQSRLLAAPASAAAPAGVSPPASPGPEESSSQVLCQLYAAALRFAPGVAEELLAAPFLRSPPPANLSAHATCQRWALPPEVLSQHVAAGFRLWQHGSALLTEQLQVLWAADPERARRLTLDGASELGRFAPQTAIWLLQQLDGADRAVALRGLRAGLRRAGKDELDNVAVVMRALDLRELLPELFARLERSRPLTDASMSTFREDLTRVLVREISRWQLSEAERRRLVSWVMGGRAARERETKDPVGQRIVEEYLVTVLRSAGLLQQG